MRPLPDPLKRLSVRCPGLLATLVLLFLVVCAFWKLVFTRQFSFIESPDIAHQVLPWLQVQATALRHGHIALWDPFLFGGQPLIGQMQPGVTSPITYLLLILPLQNGHLQPEFVNYWFVLIHCLAAIFAYWLLRDLQCSRMASVVGGLFFAIGGFNGNTNWPQILSCAIWMPLIFLFFLRSLRGLRPFGNAAFAGVFLGVSWLSGHHQVPLFVTTALGGILLFLFFHKPASGPALLPRASVLFITTALTSAVQMLPAVEYGRHAIRWVESANPVNWNTKVPYLVHENNSLRPADLLHTVLPGFAGISNPIVGVVAISVIALAILLTFDMLFTRLFTVLAAAALLFAMARHNIFHGLFYALIPFLDKARSPIMALSVVHFSLTALVGFGVDSFFRQRASPWTIRIAKYLAWFGVAAFVAVFFQLEFIRHIDRGEDRFAMVGLVGLLLAGVYVCWATLRIGRKGAAALVCALLLLEQGNSVGFNYLHREQLAGKSVLPKLTGGTDDIADFLRTRPGPARVEIKYEDVLFNFGDWYGIDALSGFVPSVPQSIYKLGWWDPSILSMYGVGYRVSYAPAREDQVELFTGSSGLKVFANSNVMPRAWSVHQIQNVKDSDEGAKVIRDSHFDFHSRAVVAGGGPNLEKCQTEDRINLSYRDTEYLSLNVDMACRGMVVISDTAFPGWVATIDGSPAKIYETNVALRGVVVDRGPHRIVMTYKPASVYLGLLFTVMGLLGAFLLYHLNKSDGLCLLRLKTQPVNSS